MWIKPKKDIDNYSTNNSEEIKRLEKNIPEIKSTICKTNDFSITFAQLYQDDVFTSKEDLKSLANFNKIDVIIFVGYAGCGHYAPARALALEYEKQNKNVILVDPLYIYSKNLAKFNCFTWKFVTRHFDFLWQITRKMLATSLGSDFCLNFAKKLQTKEILSMLEKTHPDVILSTYPYTDCILSQYTKYAKFTGIVVPDLSPVGFLNEIYHNTKEIHFFVSNYGIYEKSKQIYPYTDINAGVHVMGNIPNTLTKISKTGNTNILLFSPGSGLGIGKGFKALKPILDNWKGIIIVICGNNKKWLRKARKLSKKHSNLISFGFLEQSILHYFYEVSDVVIGKAGGSTIVELAAIEGCKIVYAPIPGQEVENALEYEKMGCITYAKNLDELVKYIKEKPQTKSVYSILNKEKSKNSAKFVVNETLKNLGQG